MIRFGIIGTGSITEEFIKCASVCEDFSLHAIYSRTEERAKRFAAAYSVEHIFTDLHAMAASDLIDAVYIASPNSFHAEQTILFLQNKKHVLCEKPIASNRNELTKMIHAANENKVRLMEAMKSIYLPNFKAVQDNLYKIGKIRRFFGTFCKYSSRYDLYKAGNNPNTFNPEFSNGSLMDLGVYCMYPVISLFGAPDRMMANALFLESGVDGQGSICLQYKDMEAVLIHSKITNSAIPTEIQGEKGSMMIDKISAPGKIEIIYNTGEVEDLTQQQSDYSMFYEINEFLERIKSDSPESSAHSHMLSLQVMDVLDAVRKEIGLIYPADIHS
ncbi:Gfo/Idh/MocA family oxidoreductase [Fodinisporobacter ferrooxydans]|uniref:Gfo/Idh/MocA family oxidoreductase n=1 Tax=Fodinisporobacter ferrooxydans TaxID=2901836 RepID=A0ABY4CLF2_9BACL|nr:Gfo/Idh/MocA family oxidoreductase [Alicyclobacillaceae bacterium MYW30-H2]